MSKEKKIQFTELTFYRISGRGYALSNLMNVIQTEMMKKISNSLEYAVEFNIASGPKYNNLDIKISHTGIRIKYIETSEKKPNGDNIFAPIETIEEILNDFDKELKLVLDKDDFSSCQITKMKYGFAMALFGFHSTGQFSPEVLEILKWLEMQKSDDNGVYYNHNIGNSHQHLDIYFNKPEIALMFKLQWL